MVSNVFSTARRYGEYGANFLLGTGATTMGNEIASTLKNRKNLNLSRTKALSKGFKDGFVKSYDEMKTAGGFFKNIRGIFSNLPKNMKDGWKSAAADNKGFWGKVGAWAKPLGKTLPFVMNALWLASSIPDIIGRTKQDGIWGGIKETAKALTNMAVISLTASVAAPFGIAAMFIAPMVTGSITTAIIGKTFSEKKAEAEEAKKLAEEQNKQNPFIQTPTTGQKLDITSAA